MQHFVKKLLPDAYFVVLKVSSNDPLSIALCKRKTPLVNKVFKRLMFEHWCEHCNVRTNNNAMTMLIMQRVCTCCTRYCTIALMYKYIFE